MLILNLFVPEFLNQIVLWKEMKEVFSVKLQTKNHCICLRSKLNKTQAAQIRNIMQSHSSGYEDLFKNKKKGGGGVCID